MTIDRRISALESRLAINERERRQYWPIPCAGGSSPVTLYRIVAGNSLAYLGSLGIIKRADAVAASELPDGAGSVATTVPPTPGAIGLPNGVGVAQSIDGTSYIWVLLDSNMGSACPDLTTSDTIVQAKTVTLVKGLFTYVLTVPESGWW